MAQRVMAYNRDCEVLCIGHPQAISQILSCNTYSLCNSNYDFGFQTYRPMIYGIEIKPCKIMQHNQIFLFPYVFEDGFPLVKGASGILEFW